MKDFDKDKKDCPARVLGLKKGNMRCDLLKPGAHNPLCREEVCVPFHFAKGEK